VFDESSTHPWAVRRKLFRVPLTFWFAMRAQFSCSARSLRQLVLALEEFRALGIDFISLHEGVDTSTPNGRLIFGIFASIAEFERELIRDRVRSGLAAAKAKGKRIGRPKVAVDALRIASLRRQGRSWAQIKDDTGISKGAAQRAMAGLPKTCIATASPSR
jgi:DNA invertase Pin-like site-specific DNA recombinase